MNQLCPPPIQLNSIERQRLETIVQHKGSSTPNIKCAQILLLTHDGMTKAQIIRTLSVTPKAVRTCRRKFRLQGIDIFTPIGTEKDLTTPPTQSLDQKPSVTHNSSQIADDPISTEKEEPQRESAVSPFSLGGFYVDAPDRALILVRAQSQKKEQHSKASKSTTIEQAQALVGPLSKSISEVVHLNKKRSFKLARSQNFHKYLDRLECSIDETAELHVIVDNSGCREPKEIKTRFAGHENWHVKYTNNAASFDELIEKILPELGNPSSSPRAFEAYSSLINALAQYGETYKAKKKPFCWLETDEPVKTSGQCVQTCDPTDQPEKPAQQRPMMDKLPAVKTADAVEPSSPAIASASAPVSVEVNSPVSTKAPSLLSRLDDLKGQNLHLPIIKDLVEEDHKKGKTDKQWSALPATKRKRIIPDNPAKEFLKPRANPRPITNDMMIAEQAQLDQSPTTTLEKNRDNSLSFKLDGMEPADKLNGTEPPRDKPNSKIEPLPEKSRKEDDHIINKTDPPSSANLTNKKNNKPKKPSASTGAGGGNGNRSNLHQRSGNDDFRMALTNVIAGFRRSIVTIAIFSVAVNVLILAIPIYLFQVSDRVLTSRSLDTLVMLSIVVVGALLVHVLLDMMRRILLMRAAVRMETMLGAPVLSAAVKASHVGSNKDFQTLMDLEQLRNFISGSVMITFFDAPLAPLFFLGVFLIHPHLGYILCVSAGLVFVVAMINQKITAVPFAKASGFGMRASLQADAMSRNALVMNAMGMIPEGVNLWGRETAESLKAHICAQDRNIYMAGLSKFIRLTTQIAMLGWGAFLAIGGELTGGMIIAASIIGSRALAPVIGTIEGWRSFVQARNGYGRIKTLLQSSPLNFERLRLPRPMGKLNVDRVLFVPPLTKKVVLNGISFSLDPGESLAIVGPSGTGKTTLARMLVGSIAPTAGNVRLDKMDIRNWDPRQFGESVGYLPQDVELFPASIKANIARMREDVSDESIFEAAEIAGVHEMISQLPQGYETPINVDGTPLSGGQKQRIGLARAFFGGPRLVVLDEPNSNLDSPGEQALAAALERAKAHDITVVAVTQRPSLLKNVDKIMVLDEGRVQKLGNREEVLLQLAGPKKAA